MPERQFASWNRKPPYFDSINPVSAGWAYKPLGASLAPDTVTGKNSTRERRALAQEQKQMSEVALDHLLGEHVLSGVDFSTIPPQGYDEEAQTCAFILDGETYIATENPGDGYRSSLGSLIVGGEVTTKFPPCHVIGRKAPDGDYEKNDVIELVDAVTGETVLEIGTGNTDDYYPYFVASFYPAAMAVNAGAI